MLDPQGSLIKKGRSKIRELVIGQCIFFSKTALVSEGMDLINAKTQFYTYADKVVKSFSAYMEKSMAGRF